MNIIDRIIHNHDSGFQIALSAIGAQHEKPKVNRWIPPSLLDNTPVMPCLAYVEAAGGNLYKPQCYLSRWLCRVLARRIYAQGEEALLSLEEIQLCKEGGIKFEVIQKRIEL